MVKIYFEIILVGENSRSCFVDLVLIKRNLIIM